MPYGITQCYLPPGRGVNPAFTPAEADTRFSDPGEMQGWVDLCCIKADRRVFPATCQSQVQCLTAVSTCNDCYSPQVLIGVFQVNQCWFHDRKDIFIVETLPLIPSVKALKETLTRTLEMVCPHSFVIRCWTPEDVAALIPALCQHPSVSFMPLRYPVLPNFCHWVEKPIFFEKNHHSKNFVPPVGKHRSQHYFCNFKTSQQYYSRVCNLTFIASMSVVVWKIVCNELLLWLS